MDANNRISVRKGEIVNRGGSEITTPDKAGTLAPKRKPTKKEQLDIIGIEKFFDRFSSEEAATAFVEECVWGETPFCPKCGSDNVYESKGGKPMKWRCRACWKFFSVRVGTVFEETNLTFKKWLLAIYFMLSDRHGVSSVNLSKLLDVKQDTAWHLEMRIREAMREDDPPMMRGTVQVDETYIGGIERWKHAKKKLHGDWQKGRITVFGLKEGGPGGKVMAFPLKFADIEEIRDGVLDNVHIGSIICTDGHAAYRGLEDFGYGHEKVEHRIGQYVNDNGGTTNAIESFWALFKGTYRGTYHGVSRKHLRRYLDESTYRLNSGKGNGFESIKRVIRGMVGKRLTYEQLTGRKQD
ncbi:MAG: IS1595 family transposase [Chloroflexota bacterium]|nr:IS1595 family transposase [Chloroflexota bacterium]MDE2683266.1 IS1595 family transposase [Chloroflexota bacterium]